jgi:hypothetical protein
MREVIIPFSSTVVDEAGREFAARVIGHQRSDGIWEGRVEFIGESGQTLSTSSETTQPNQTGLEYWASGLEKVYLEGALARARRRMARRASARNEARRFGE